MPRLVAVVRENGTNEIVDALMTEHIDDNNENLSGRLLKLWPPFIYYIETMITDDLHSYFGEAEIERIGMFAKANAEGRPVYRPPARRFKCDFSDLKVLRQAKEILIGCFRQHRCDVAIVTGEAHYKMYDNEVYDAVADCTGGAENKPMFICGPVLLIEDAHRGNRTEDSVVLRLWKAGKLDLWYSNVRQPIHFRLGGTDTLYIEEPHAAGATTRFGWLFQNSKEVGVRFRKTIDHVIKSQNVRRSEGPDDFLLLTSTELNKVKRICREELPSGRKRDYDEYSRQDLAEIIEEYQVLEE